jgi:hypothetical protein
MIHLYIEPCDDIDDTPMIWSFIAGWWYTYPSEKYERHLGLLFPTYGKNKKCAKPPTSIDSNIDDILIFYVFQVKHGEFWIGSCRKLDPWKAGNHDGNMIDLTSEKKRFYHGQSFQGILF